VPALRMRAGVGCRYLAPPGRCMVMLYQASKTVVDPENEELVDYLGELHEAILEAYVWTLHAARLFLVC